MGPTRGWRREPVQAWPLRSRRDHTWPARGCMGRTHTGGQRALEARQEGQTPRRGSGGSGELEGGRGKASPRRRRKGAARVQTGGRGQWGLGGSPQRRPDQQSRPARPEANRPHVHQVPRRTERWTGGGDTRAGGGGWQTPEGSSCPRGCARDPGAASPGASEAPAQGGHRDSREPQGKQGRGQMQAHRPQGQGREGCPEGSPRGQGPGEDRDTDRPHSAEQQRSASATHPTCPPLPEKPGIRILS